MVSQIIASQFLASLSVMSRTTHCTLDDQRDRSLYHNDPAFVIAQLARSILDSLCQDVHTVSWNPNLVSTTDVNKRIWRHFSPTTLGTRGANDDLCITAFLHEPSPMQNQGSHQKSFNIACGNVIGSEQHLPRHLSLTVSVLPWHSMAAVSIINSIAQNLCPPPSNSPRQTDHG